MDLEGARIDRAVFKDYGESLVGGAIGTNTGTTYMVDLDTGNAFHLILTGNCTFTFSNPAPSGTACTFTLFLKQDATGSRTATWPASVVWAGGTAPTLTTTAKRYDMLTFTTVDGGTRWLGFVGGQNYALANEIFAATLYTGNGAARSVSTGVNISTHGGMVWFKDRSSANGHSLFDTARGVSLDLNTASTAADNSVSTRLTSFDSNGFSIGTNAVVNSSGNSYVAWSFRKAANFFDVVTYTGDGLNNHNIAHSLGIAPGMIIVKDHGAIDNWYVWHRSGGFSGLGGGYLNLTNAFGDQSDVWQAAPTSTEFSLRNGGANVSGHTYVAYLFAHDTSGAGNIQCGSYTGNGSATGPIVTLGWEPQYILWKRADSANNWFIIDKTRGWSGANELYLYADSSAAEPASFQISHPTSTGFVIDTADVSTNANGGTYIYMAIRA